MTGVLSQSIELHCKVEGCGELVVDGSQIGRRITFAVGTAVVNEFVLPIANIGRLDGIDRHLTKVRKDFLIEQVSNAIESGAYQVGKECKSNFEALFNRIFSYFDK